LDRGALRPLIIIGLWPEGSGNNKFGYLARCKCEVLFLSQHRKIALIGKGEAEQRGGFGNRHPTHLVSSLVVIREAPVAKYEERDTKRGEAERVDDGCFVK